MVQTPKDVDFICKPRFGRVSILGSVCETFLKVFYRVFQTCSLASELRYSSYQYWEKKVGIARYVFSREMPKFLSI